MQLHAWLQTMAAHEAAACGRQPRAPHRAPVREIDARDPSSVDIERIVADGQPVLLRGYHIKESPFNTAQIVGGAHS